MLFNQERNDSCRARSGDIRLSITFAQRSCADKRAYHYRQGGSRTPKHSTSSGRPREILPRLSHGLDALDDIENLYGRMTALKVADMDHGPGRCRLQDHRQ